MAYRPNFFDSNFKVGGEGGGAKRTPPPHRLRGLRETWFMLYLGWTWKPTLCEQGSQSLVWIQPLHDLNEWMNDEWIVYCHICYSDMSDITVWEHKYIQLLELVLFVCSILQQRDMISQCCLQPYPIECMGDKNTQEFGRICNWKEQIPNLLSKTLIS